MNTSLTRRAAGRDLLRLPPLGFGAFKIGRNQGIKYPTPYDLPDMDAVRTLIQGIRQLGCNYFDTAPAYGLSEERLGSVLADDPSPCVISTKVGETFEAGTSTFDFSRRGIEDSLNRSRQRLRRDVLDLVFIHSHGDDLEILERTPVVDVLREWRERGLIRAIGMSGKSAEGAAAALAWADAIMVEYHLQDHSLRPIMDQAGERGVAVVVKKGLASGRLPPEDALQFVLEHPAVTSVVVGGLNLSNFERNWQTALQCRNSQSPKAPPTSPRDSLR